MQRFHCSYCSSEIRCKNLLSIPHTKHEITPYSICKSAKVHFASQ